ncbi:MAG: glutathione peroxidase [Taibaiella sp.]|nr:glutathione peroxidase [Taibaiella sp.]
MPSILQRLFGNNATIPHSIYDFKVAGLTGGTIDFSAFKGKKIMVVNTASFCGNTPQYEQLEKLYEQHKDKLVVVGFPANNFMFQEPGSNEKIASFCKTNYGVTFPMAAKVSVRGWRKNPIYQWLTEQQHNHFADSTVKWNFQKYLLDETGKLTHIFSPKTLPLSEEVLAAVKS